MKYLFIGAHPDDIELSCAGTICKITEEGHKVFIKALSDCGSSVLFNEYVNSVDVLGWGDNRYIDTFDTRCFAQQTPTIADSIIELLESIKPDFVISHSEKCKHPDHRTTGQEVKRVYNGNLITFIQPWNGNEDPNFFFELSEKHLEKKIEALKCYKSQAHRSYMSDEFIRAQAVYNGIKCGKRYAEAFKIERYIQ